jgi:hypothetical protein
MGNASGGEFLVRSAGHLLGQLDATCGPRPLAGRSIWPRTRLPMPPVGKSKVVRKSSEFLDALTMLV